MSEWLLAVFCFLHEHRRWRSDRLETNPNPAKFFNLAPALITRRPPPDPPTSIARSLAPPIPSRSRRRRRSRMRQSRSCSLSGRRRHPTPCPMNDDADNDGEGGGRQCGAIVVFLLASLNGNNDGSVVIEEGV
jgi:hypothetical protein